MLFFELFPMFVALVCVIVMVTLVALNRQASRRSEFFTAAAASYLLYEDPWAMQAAILAALTADRDTRTDAIAALHAIARSPDPLIAPLLSADAERSSPLQAAPSLEASAVIGRRAAHLATLIVRFDGNVRGLRQDLVRQAPRYEHALKGRLPLDITPFTRLDPVAIERLARFMAQPRVS